MLGLLFLLLPVAVAYGWYMGQRSVRRGQQHQATQVSKQYVEGLDLLLSNQSEEALDRFIELLQVDDEAIDTHLALGNLFRQRGEVDKAIRIHQNLISRQNISIEQRNLAQLQLARDYLAAGLFDRAEKIFRMLLEEPEQRATALSELLNIYQQTRDWRMAIDVARKISAKDKPEITNDVAHFYCELALEAERAGDLPQAKKHLKKALSVDIDCTRASLHLAQLLVEEKDDKQALKVLNRVPEQDPEMLLEVVPLYQAICERLGQQSHYRDFLEYCCGTLDAGATVMLALASEIQQQDGIEAALAFVDQQIKRHPTMRGFHRLMQYHSELLKSRQAKQSLQALSDLVNQQLRERAQFRCQHCGFSSHAIYWHCPSCKSWGSVKPIRGLDGE
ncbi:lipopolysaccharide assembly protein LapB [Aliagarivorans taiwanensis]|uniref:lipopolysaccharide assembly protein LapB n=1 Tax=Aliagarivorans taiwanensis TaxID=561966 RepID=UPI000403E469|nr:lipopolysaccharide assembly protein LapB [Aliagarivorans taiwanensis]